MKKSILTTLVAASIALTSFAATPAFAGKKEDDLVRFLAGAAVIYMIARQADQNNNAPVQRRAPARHARKALPARCRVDYQNGNGRWRTGYLRHCTQNQVARPGRLPQSCIRDGWTNRGHRKIYNRHCMKQHGWHA